jgi:hypothetical protein
MGGWKPEDCPKLERPNVLKTIEKSGMNCILVSHFRVPGMPPPRDFERVKEKTGDPQ